jgi:hypothetical protein
LFNILLSNDGGEVTSPGTPQFNDIRQAFGGEDRYLGLTITVDPSGTITSPSEISPRQQLASAPFAMQAQTANSVRNLGVTTAAMANGAVSTSKISDGNVTTAKIANEAVTSSKLNIDGDVSLNGHSLHLNSGDNGPALYGSTTGVLGTTESGEKKAALTWDNNGGVSLFGVPHDLTSTIPGVGSSKTYTANADGILTLYAYAETWYIQILKGGSSSVFSGKDVNSPSFGGAMQSGENAYGKVFMWPIKSGDKIQLYRHHSHTTVIGTKLYFYPFGVSRSNPITAN